MRINFNSKERKEKYLTKWHVWFAWYPIYTKDNYLIWLEKIYRRIDSNWAGQTKYYRCII